MNLRDTRCDQSSLDLRVCAERRRPLFEEQIHAHVCRSRIPHAVRVFGSAGLVVEVARAVIGAAARGATKLEKVDERESVEQITVPKDEVLVVLDALLPVEVDVKKLAVL